MGEIGSVGYATSGADPGAGVLGARLAELTGGEAWTLSKGSHMPVLTNGPEVAEFIQRAVGVYNEQ